MRLSIQLAIISSSLLIATFRRTEATQREQASAVLRKAVDYFRKNVATEGGYLWRYSADLSKREGEGKASATQVWVQPPGTPAVGLAYLTAYDATGDAYYLEAARETAEALLKGQLRSGGWTYQVEFDPALRKKFALPHRSAQQGPQLHHLDDNTTQSAVRLLARLDVGLEAEGREDPRGGDLRARLRFSSRSIPTAPGRRVLRSSPTRPNTPSRKRATTPATIRGPW